MSAQVATGGTSSISSRGSRSSRGSSSRASSTVGSGTYEGTFEGSNSLTSSIQMREENSTLGSLGGSSRSGLQSAGVDGDGGTNNSATSSMNMRGENSTCSSSFANELSLPSSFASSTNGSSASRGGAGTTAVISDIHDNDSDSLVTRQLPSSQDGDSGRLEVYDNGQGQVSLTGGGDTTVTSAEGSEANSEDQLALRISKETKPMMHLLRLLKDIDDRNGNEHADPKSKAVASLISDFEQEVSLIEHRMKDENLIMNGEHPPLPPNWIALEDPDSGDVYFANEATGETQWERPGLISELKERLQEMNSSAMSHDSLMKPSNMRTNTFDNKNDGGSMQGSNRSNDFRNNSNRSNNYEQQQQQLQGSNMSNNYEQRGGGGAGMDSSNASNNFDGSQGNMSNTYNTSNTSNNHHKQQQQQQDKNNMRSSNLSNNFENFEGSHSNMTNTLESSLTDSHKSGAFNNDLPPDWIALEDPDSGETYYANEVSGESTWDKPPMPQSLLPQETQQSVGSGSAVNDDDEGDDDDDLPPDWIALEDADSGDTYYLNQVTMATTWDRPGTKGNNASVNKADVGENDESSSHLQQSENDIASNQGDLPPGWESILDPSSGDHYYAHESGETQWERPEFTESALLLLSEGEDDDTTSNQQHQQQGPSLGNNTDGDTHDVSTHDDDDDDMLPHGWFEAIDEDSGDKYYCNEVTGETSWDFPTESEIENNPNQAPAIGGEEEENDIDDVNDNEDDDLPPGWFAVPDPSSGDLYYCNEETGETTWDLPTISGGGGTNSKDAKKNNTEQHLMSRLSINDNTVYEDDSVTSSQY